MTSHSLVQKSTAVLATGVSFDTRVQLVYWPEMPPEKVPIEITVARLEGELYMSVQLRGPPAKGANRTPMCTGARDWG
jgi:hypothetical protein